MLGKQETLASLGWLPGTPGVDKLSEGVIGQPRDLLCHPCHTKRLERGRTWEILCWDGIRQDATTFYSVFTAAGTHDYLLNMIRDNK